LGAQVVLATEAYWEPFFGLKVAHRFSFARGFLQGSTFLPPVRWTLKFWEVSFGRLDEDGFAKLSHLFVGYLGTLVQDGLAHMRDLKWRAVPAKFKTGMCEIKILGSEVLWCIFGTLVQDESVHTRGVICSGKVQNRDVRDENFRIWNL
jgi:hypothetical protein